MTDDVQASQEQQGTPSEVLALKTALMVALHTLEQIGSTPRNKQARIRAKACHAFLTTQLAERARQ